MPYIHSNKAGVLLLLSYMDTIAVRDYVTVTSIIWNNELMSKRGVFISLEGIEGCGKSTQAKLLAQYLSELGYSFILTHEPGGTPLAEKLREILLDPDNTNITAITELLLYLASRAQHVEQVIMPALAEGKVVICERFSDATFAYQGYARGLGLELVEKVDKVATKGLKPDLTLLLDLEVKEGLIRAGKRGNRRDRLESESIEFHNKVRDGYLTIASRSPNRVKVIDADRSVEDVQICIRKYVTQRLVEGR